MSFTIFESPLGDLTLVAGADGALRHLYFPGTAPALGNSDRDPQRLAAATEQLEQYFRGERTMFDLELKSPARRSRRTSGAPCAPSPMGPRPRTAAWHAGSTRSRGRSARPSAPRRSRS